jgi:hypothetical protein
MWPRTEWTEKYQGVCCFQLCSLVPGHPAWLTLNSKQSVTPTAPDPVSTLSRGWGFSELVYWHKATGNLNNMTKLKSGLNLSLYSYLGVNFISNSFGEVRKLIIRTP